MSEYLHRGDAPFGEDVWEKIDDAVINAAKMQLSARKILPVEGPYGIDLKFLPGTDAEVEEGMSVSTTTPLVSIHKTFTIPTRDIANFVETGKPLDLSMAAQTAIEIAKMEEDLVYNGSRKLGVEGLLKAKGVQSISLQPWEEVGMAADDLIKAVTKLDETGFHGPYVLALSPERYNMLYRRYKQGNMTELDHIKTLVTKGVVKAPSLDAGGLLLMPGKQYASIVLGQDLMTGFVGPVGGAYEFTISESLTPKLLQPKTICVLK